MKQNFIFFISLFLFSCEKKQASHPVFDYYPISSVFEDGYVSKYYVHYYPDNPDRVSGAEIRYIKSTKLSADQFKTESYNAGFELVNNRSYRINGETVILESGVGIFKSDTVPLDIINNITTVWRGSMDVPYQSRFESNDKEYIFSEYQKSVSDTLIDKKRAKKFSSEWSSQEVGKDSLFNQGSSKSYYVADLGFFGSDSEGATYKRKWELIEQMSVEEFEKRANHKKSRIGYIDPKSTLSDDSGFDICGLEESIMDYYNLDPSAQYIDRKGEMRRLILKQLDKSKLQGQSGMLTFRFVINCQGEAGRFIVNGVDFNFQKKEFSKEAIDHLLKILQGLDSWQDLGDNGEKDAYMYITFKIEDEEITDILP